MTNRNDARIEARLDRLYEAVNALRDRLDAHLSNHHSRASTIKQSGVVGAILTLAYAAVELLRRFAV